MGDTAVTRIDERVLLLVRALNSVPGISTFSSCGGHEAVTNPCQAPAGEFYVNFKVIPHYEDEDVDGLGLVAWAVGEGTVECQHDRRDENITLSVWFNGLDWPDGHSCYELRGRDGADPDRFAELLWAQMAKRFDEEE